MGVGSDGRIVIEENIHLSAGTVQAVAQGEGEGIGASIIRWWCVTKWPSVNKVSEPSLGILIG